GTELAIQAVFGQQVSLAAARTLASRLVTAHGDVIKIADPTLTHLFPHAAAIAEADLARLGVPATRRATLRGLARAVAGGTLALDPGADRNETYQQLLQVPGIGDWTAGYIVMRALVAPDAGLRAILWHRLSPARAGIQPRPRRNPDHPVLKRTASQLDEYFAGRRTTFDIPLDLQGTRFQLAAWRSLAGIPFGTTTS